MLQDNLFMLYIYRVGLLPSMSEIKNAYIPTIYGSFLRPRLRVI